MFLIYPLLEYFKIFTKTKGRKILRTVIFQTIVLCRVYLVEMDSVRYKLKMYKWTKTVWREATYI